MTCILAVQVGGIVHMAGDTRIVCDEEYFDGYKKVFKLNGRVLVGYCGDTVIVDLYLLAAPLISKSRSARSAARAARALLQEHPGASGADWTLLFVSRNEAAELSQNGVVEIPFGDGSHTCAGTGGPLAAMHWVATDGRSVVQSVCSVARFRVDCSPDAMSVSTEPVTKARR